MPWQGSRLARTPDKMLKAFQKESAEGYRARNGEEDPPTKLQHVPNPISLFLTSAHLLWRTRWVARHPKVTAASQKQGADSWMVFVVLGDSH